jgi:putative transport protein
MEFVRTLLEQQPMVTLFLTIAVGYLAGQISIKGFSPGVGAVLFVALAAGWWVPKAIPAPIVGTLGLALFLYSVGIQYGKEFFNGLASAQGRKANLIALIGVGCAGAVTLALISAGAARLGHALGLFAGSGVSTAALQAAIQTLGNDDAAVGYSVAYPFGVAGPILILYLAFSVLKPRVDSASSTGLVPLEIAVRNPQALGIKLSEVQKTLPSSVRIVAVRDREHNEAAFADLVLAENDVVLAVASSHEALEQARKQLGEAAPGRIADDRRDLDYLGVFASSTAVIGRPLGALAPAGGIPYSVTHVRRGDSDLAARPDLVLEYGDRVGLLLKRSGFEAARKFFGDSIRGAAEFSYVAMGLGLALGLLVGCIRVPLPHVGQVSLGLGGVLLVALVLGKLRHIGGLSLVMPAPANLVLRNFGLTLFLAQVGMSSGPKFVATVAQTGFLFLGFGALIVLALALPILILGVHVFRMSFDEVGGIIAGACGNPAILAYANRLTPTERPDIGYAMIFPGITILKILFVQIVPALLGS